jgi:hypothetical protein
LRFARESVAIRKLFGSESAYTEDTVTERSEQRPKLEINTDGLNPFINYRNPKDDKIGSAIQEAAKRLTEQGKPLVHPKKD